ncbi:MAG: hypothetical protein J6S53_06460 [Lentisphaeria bacterium]|nr:hypothetical protein [Lentisphaeria bacterium]
MDKGCWRGAGAGGRSRERWGAGCQETDQKENKNHFGGLLHDRTTAITAIIFIIPAFFLFFPCIRN